MPRYANITATLALFVALGGTATAAVTLPRDSVTAREIAKNAVGSSEIRPEAVRSSELEDETIALGDLADRTRRELQGAQGPAGPAGPAGPSGTSEARFTEDDQANVDSCASTDLTDCENVQSVLLTAGSWAVQAKFTAFGNMGPLAVCGLVADDTTTVDEAAPLTNGANSNVQHVSLADVITVAEPTRVAVRCTEFLPGDIELLDLKLVAISVDDVVVF
jgi:hypothetical protein